MRYTQIAQCIMNSRFQISYELAIESGTQFQPKGFPYNIANGDVPKQQKIYQVLEVILNEGHRVLDNSYPIGQEFWRDDIC